VTSCASAGAELSANAQAAVNRLSFLINFIFVSWWLVMNHS
jgi:hypothetical protein